MEIYKSPHAAAASYFYLFFIIVVVFLGEQEGDELGDTAMENSM